MRKQSESIELLAEFEGEKIAGRTIAVLSSRIDALIKTAVSKERRRCHDAAIAAAAKITLVED